MDRDSSTRAFRSSSARRGQEAAKLRFTPRRPASASWTTIGGTDNNGFDAIADSIKDEVNSGTDPDGLFINPTDSWYLRGEEGPVAGQYKRWGVRGSAT